MYINFLHNPICPINPIIIGDTVIKRVNAYKILGVIMANDMKWNSHVDYIIGKACKKLCSLRVLRITRVSQSNILRIYLSTARPVLEYAIPVWQDIPAESYAHALQLGKLDRLDDRRIHLCYKYMAKMKSPNHPLYHLLPNPLLDAPNYPPPPPPPPKADNTKVLSFPDHSGL